MTEMIKKNEKKINDSLLLFKIIIIGCSNVGKTEILNSFITNCIFKNNTKPTVGISFVSAKDIIDNNLVRFQIWDTAGEERYRSVIINYFKKAKGALIVYDITNEESFEQLDYWYNELKNQTDAEIILVGNNGDLLSPNIGARTDGAIDHHKVAVVAVAVAVEVLMMQARI